MINTTIETPIVITLDDPCKPKTLSDAILRGCELVPQQAFGCYRETFHEGTVYAACALGAAYIGFTLKTRMTGEDRVYDTLSEQLDNGLHRIIVTMPDTGEHMLNGVGPLCTQRSLYDAITYLNDRSNWTRERIAAWLKEQGL